MRLLHPVADAGHGSDAGSGSLTAGRGQLLSQVLDVGVGRALVTGVGLALDRLQERQPLEHPSGAPREGGQEAKLGRGERERCSLPRRFVPRRVHPQRTHQERRLPVFGGAGPPQNRADAGQQGPGAEGLGDVVVGAQLQSHQLVDLLGTSGQHDDRDVRVPPQAPADLQTVQLRQHEVEHDQVRPRFQEARERLPPVVGAHDPVAVVFEVVAHDLHQLRLVVDHEYGALRAHLLP